MRILMVNYEYPPLGGGGGIAMKEIAEELAKSHEVHVLTSGTSSLPRLEKHPALNLTLHRARVVGRSARATASFLSMAAYLPAGCREGSRLLAQQQFDVVNTWFAIPSGIVGGTIARRHGVPHVLTVIGGDIYDPSKWYSPHRFFLSGLGVKWALNRADFHVAISSDIARRTKQYFAFDGPIDLIPLGIADPVVQKVPRAVVGMSDARKYIVAVGRLVRRKDYPTLLRALKALEREDVSLLLLGDGPERENLQRLARQLGLEERVEFRGFVPEMEKFQILSNADVFALVSLHEGFGVVYLEAMYCGLPVVAADVGGQVDLLEHGRTGSLVAAGEIAPLAKALAAYLDDTQMRTRMGTYNRQRFHEFSVANLARKYEAIYQNAYSGGPDFS